MPRPGPPPKPTHLKKLAGNPGKRALNKHEPKPKGPLFEAPDDLPEAAVPFWNYAIRCAPRGLLKRLDQRTLAIYAVAAAAHSAAAEICFREGITIKKRNMKMAHVHPAMRIVDAQAGIMMRACVEMGFTPSSRSRIIVKEGILDEDPIEPDNPFDEFAQRTETRQ